MTQIDPWPNLIDNRYEIELGGSLGLGAMGEVHKYGDRRLNRRTVAVKRLKSSGRNSPAARDRFSREAETLATLDHPNIVAVRDVVNQDGGTFLVTEFVDGVTLHDHLEAQPGKGLSVSVACELMGQVADALTASHRYGIVHRDIKPSNIMVKCGAGIKLLDFGIAKLVIDFTCEASDHDGPTLLRAHRADDGETETMGFIGTPGYAAPEQCTPGGTVAELADIFSLGVLLFECITGQRAIQGSGAAELLIATREGKFNFHALPQGLDLRLSALLAAMMAVVPEHRTLNGQPLTAAVVLFELKELQRVVSATVQPSRLPRWLTTMVGRDYELDVLGRMLALRRHATEEDQTRGRAWATRLPFESGAEYENPDESGGCGLVTLKGTGGIGKTRLAVKAAGNACKLTGCACVYVDLRPVADDRQSVEQAILAALGETKLSMSAVVGLTIRARDRGLLVVLDNCETVAVSLAPIVTETLQLAPEGMLRIIATSRQPVGVAGEQLFEVLPLQLPEELRQKGPISDALVKRVAHSEAVRLFRSRARLVKRDFEVTPENVVAVAAVCRKLQGMPVMIELAAAMSQAVDPGTILKTLDRMSAATLDMQMLDRLLSCSIATLDAGLVGVLRALSVFDGSFDLEAARAVVPDREDLVDDVRRLVSCSLVSADTTPHASPYMVPVTVRTFCRQGMAAAALKQGRSRLVLWALSITERYQPQIEAGENTHAPLALRMALDNIREAWRVAEGFEEARRGASRPMGDARRRIALAMSRYFYMAGPRNVGIEMIGQSQLSDIDSGDAPADKLAGLLYKAAGTIQHGATDWPAAEHWARLALGVFTRLDEPLLVAQLQNNLGCALAGQRKFGEARQLQHEAERFYRATENRNGIASVTLNRAFTEIEAKQWADSLVLSVAAVSMYKRLDDPHRLAVALHNQGVGLLKLGQIQDSIELFVESIRKRTELDENFAVQTLIFLSSAYIQLGDRAWVEHGARYLGYAIHRSSRIGSPVDALMQEEINEAIGRLSGLLSKDVFEVWMSQIADDVSVSRLWIDYPQPTDCPDLHPE